MIEIKKEVTIGNQILEVGDKIKERKEQVAEKLLLIKQRLIKQRLNIANIKVFKTKMN